MGRRAEAIGQRLATERGCRYVADQIVERATELAGATAADVATVEHSQSLIARILTALAMSAVPDSSAVGSVVLAVPTPVTQTALCETADNGEITGAAGYLVGQETDTMTWPSISAVVVAVRRPGWGDDARRWSWRRVPPSCPCAQGMILQSVTGPDALTASERGARTPPRTCQ